MDPLGGISKIAKIDPTARAFVYRQSLVIVEMKVARDSNDRKSIRKQASMAFCYGLEGRCRS